ncbi:MAG TPA: hypothetical protein VFI34_07410 [Candidatus Limnocylindrales bacterium]|nr:hypothetical protein [Candidatus Limnocylindrales bacterium]
MERDLEGGNDVGRDELRDLADDATGALRDTAPDPLAPIDASAPVSGHVPAPESHAASIAESPEHDWAAASAILFPLLRPAGTQGLEVASIDAAALAADSSRSHSQPLVDEGPAGLAVVYAMPGSGFDVIVNGDHLLSWGVAATSVQDAAMRNLAAWSTGAAWTDEVSGERRLISSDTGDGWDASRILLPEVRQRLASELGGDSRILIGLPERHLLVAGALRPGDDEFAGLFADFVLEASGGADEPVDRRVFELTDGRLLEFPGLPTPA